MLKLFLRDSLLPCSVAATSLTLNEKSQVQILAGQSGDMKRIWVNDSILLFFTHRRRKWSTHTPDKRGISRFKSCSVYVRDVIQRSRSQSLGLWSRRFESCHPDHCLSLSSMAEWLPFKQTDQSSSLWRPMRVLAQLAEQLPCKRKVAGSTPARTTNQGSVA
jgi:hypothetical protein